MRGFHQGQSNQMLTNRPVIVTQSDLGTSPALQLRGSPYSRGNRRCAGLSRSVRVDRRVGRHAECLHLKLLAALGHDIS